MPRISSRASQPAIWLLLLCVVYGCHDDRDTGPQPGNDHATVILNIRTPAATTPRVAGRIGQTAEETRVADIHVLIFNDLQGTGEYRYDYMVSGTQLVNQPDLTSRFQVLLRASTIPIKLMLVANAGNIFSTYTPAIGDTEESVRASLTRDFTPTGFTTELPMYGQLFLPTLDATTTTVLDAIVLRAVARVDVVTDLIPTTQAFDLREVHIYRANNSIQIIPNTVITSQNSAVARVTEPSIPASATLLAEPVIKTAVSGTDSIGGLYLPESASVSQQNQRQEATAVVVGGIFDGDTQITYYRIDFHSALEGHPFGQVLRNYLYTFTIRHVTARGWATPEEAAQNLATSITVEVKQWEDFTTDMYFPDNYIGVSTRQVDLPFLPNHSGTIDVESSMLYSIQWANDPTAGTVSDEGVPLSDGYFTATIVHDAAEQNYISHIRIESSEYNISDQPVTDTLRIIAHDTRINIIVRKDSPAQHAGRIIRVLSVGTSYGSMGNYDAPNTLTQAMRNILDYNSLPISGSSFPIEGFFYISVPTSSPTYSAATTPAAVASFKRFISNFDVVILTYENLTSPQVADMLLDQWLVENPHRVLWVMRDAAASNVAVLSRTAQDGEGVWNNIGPAFSATAGYRYSRPTDYAYNNEQDVYEFFNGPFGTINNQDTTLVLRPGDTVAGASQIPNSAKQYVTPLVYSNNPGYRDYMSVGVNKSRGIIYQGEAQFFQGSIGMSPNANTNGTIVATPDANGQYYYDVLMGNIWAWVTGRVIYGPAAGE